MNINMQEARKELEAFSKDTHWYSDHYDTLREQYPAHWIAIYNQEVVAASPEMDEMFDTLETKGIDSAKAFIKFLSTESDLWTLSTL